MESFNPHEYVPRRLDAPAKFLLWDFDLVASGIAGLAFGIIVNSLLMGAVASYAAIRLRSLLVLHCAHSLFMPLPRLSLSMSFSPSA